MAKKNICVIGAGRWGKNHIRTLYQMEELGGIVESNKDLLSDILDLYKNVDGYTSIHDTFDIDFGGYVIATPAETHYEMAKLLLLNGKNVLIEKPMTLSSKDSSDLINIAEENKCKLMVGHLLLFHPAIQKIKKVIDSGEMGQIQYIYSNRLNLGTVRTEENVFWSFAPHDISIINYFLESSPCIVSANGGRFLQEKIHDTTIAYLEYPNNIKAHIFVSWLHPFKEQRLVVIGTKGMIVFEDSTQKKEILFYDKGIDWVKGTPISREDPTKNITYEMSSPLENELRYFIDNTCKSINISDGKSGLEVVEILESVTESLLKNGKTIKLSNDKSSYFAHETAYIDNDVILGDETKVWHYSHIQSGSKLGINCSVGQNVNIGNNVTIGDYVKIQNNVSVYEGVVLEDYVFCGPSMVFTNVLNPRCKYPQRGSEHYRKTLVKEGASIGANATIVCGHTIGKHAFIAAGAVIASDVPDYAIMMGVPARQKGWICECGTKMDVDYRCPKCNKKYILSNLTLIEKES